MQVFTASPAAIYTGMGNALTRISSTEGFRALWRGVTSVIVGAGPAHAVHFGAYEAAKELFGGNEVGSDAGNVFLATGSDLFSLKTFVTHFSLSWCWCNCYNRQ